MSQEFENKARDFLDTINRRIDELLSRHDISKEDIKSGIDERVEELKKAKAKIEKELKDFSEDNRENFDRIERAIGDAAKEIGDAFKDIFKFSGSKEEDDGADPKVKS